MANSEDPDEMQHHAAFHQGLHCLLRLKQHAWIEIHHSLENSSCDPFKYTMGSPILIVSICMGKSIRIQRVKNQYKMCVYSTGIHGKCEPHLHEWICSQLENRIDQDYMGPAARKPVFRGWQTTQAQTSLRIRAV